MSKFLEIDENQLDREWIKQPTLMYKYSCKLAEHKQVLDEEKNALEIVKAEMSSKIRSEPKEYGIEKVTEGAINGAVLLSDEMKEATDAVNVAKHDVDILSAAVNALEHRKRALECLVSLHGQSYFSTPRADAEGQAALEEQSKTSVRRRRKRVSS